MDPKIIWLFVVVALYWSYCIFSGIKSALSARTASDYFIAGRGISVWVFVLAATATSFSAWTFMGHPGLFFRDGFQYGFASFFAITIPFTGVIFLKRQWMLGKRFGFVTPGEMLSYYFKSDTVRLLTVFVALMFSIPYLAIQLRASGFLFNVLTDGMLDVNAGMWMLAIVIILYVASGGLRAVAYVDTLQAVLLTIGIVAIGVITLNHVGGWAGLTEGIGTLAEADPNRTPDGFSRYVAIPGVIQFVSDGPSAAGGAWTGVMILTYMFALMGIQSAPSFSMWAFSNASPKPFAPQQVWASSLVIGGILFLFTPIQGFGAQLLGLDLAAVPGGQDALVPKLIALTADTAPWFMALLAVCALAAMQSTGAAYMSTTGGMITRDVLKRFLMPYAGHMQQKLMGRIAVAAIVLAALAVAVTADDALVLMGGLAVAYGLQMWPALVAVCWQPFFTGPGIVAGMAAGIIAVTLTDSIGAQFMPWGRWPLTIHSAGWGIFINFGVAFLVSAVTQNKEAREQRMVFHNFLQEHAGLPERKKNLAPLAWIAAIVWFLFAVGPGAVIGNTLFGDPNTPGEWILGMPSIWIWQIIWWVLGVGMMWFLAYKMELSTVPEKTVVSLYEDIDDVRLDTNKP
ncbi:MAG: sodium:solute symporter family protein [Gammaproteobacteria bacterium]|nr:sodium:solute symporter family protein [Gammaproteobacteria bacterium]